MTLKKLLTFFGWPLLLLPTLLLVTGMYMNEAVIHANGGRMPVYAYHCDQRMADRADDEGHEDYVHACMTDSTKDKAFGDILVSDSGMYSIGDELQIEYDTFEKICYGLWATIGAFCLIRKEKFYAE